MKKKLELNDLSISSFVTKADNFKGGIKPAPPLSNGQATNCYITGPCCDITFGCTINTCDPGICEPFTF